MSKVLSRNGPEEKVDEIKKEVLTRIPNLTSPADIQPLESISELSSDQRLIFQEFSKHVYDNLLLQIDDPDHQREKEWLNEKCLKRYLRASKWNLDEAKHRIKYSLEWRREYKPSEIEPKSIEAEAVTGKQHLNGFDNNGRPILYLKPGLQNTLPGPDQLRFVVFNFESAITIMPENVENIVIIIDFDKCSARTSPGLGVAKEFMHVLSSHYPERLGYSLVINAPWYFWGFFKLISPFIDPVTKNKIKFVDMHNPDKAAQNVHWVNCLDLIREDQLESEYGGSNAFEHHHETYWKALCERVGKSPN